MYRVYVSRRKTFRRKRGAQVARKILQNLRLLIVAQPHSRRGDILAVVPPIKTAQTKSTLRTSSSVSEERRDRAAISDTNRFLLPSISNSTRLPLMSPVGEKNPLAETVIGLIGETVKYAFSQVGDRMHVESFNFNDLSSGTYTLAGSRRIITREISRYRSRLSAGLRPAGLIIAMAVNRSQEISRLRQPSGSVARATQKLHKLLIRAREKPDPRTFLTAFVLRSRENFMADRLSSSNRSG